MKAWIKPKVPVNRNTPSKTNDGRTICLINCSDNKMKHIILTILLLISCHSVKAKVGFLPVSEIEISTRKNEQHPATKISAKLNESGNHFAYLHFQSAGVDVSIPQDALNIIEWPNPQTIHVEHWNNRDGQIVFNIKVSPHGYSTTDPRYEIKIIDGSLFEIRKSWREKKETHINHESEVVYKPK